MSVKYCDVKKLVAGTRGNRWWEELDKKGKNDVKWTSLRHNGVYFPPPYEPLPKNIKVLHQGKPVDLDAKNINNPFYITAEEAAVFFAMKLEQDARLSAKTKARRTAMEDKTFLNNFWADWKKILGPNHTIKSLKDVDFTPLQRFLVQRSEQKKAAKKAMSKEEKQAEKDQKEAIKDLYGYAVVDDIKIPLGQYMVQPPGLYMGHGEHPMRGKIKRRIMPSDVTLNISKSSVPKCFYQGQACKWGEIVEDHLGTWIAAYKHPITGEKTYVWLNRTESHWVCVDDKAKFDKARNLHSHIDQVRNQYKKDLSSTDSDVRQLATAVYLLDRLAIRPGTEKDESKEAGTQGLTTLNCGNIEFLSEDKIRVNFVGKSSIPFVKKFKVDSQAFKNLQQLCKGKKDKDKLFPGVDATSLNDYLKTLLPDLTAKVFRTYKASSILQAALDQNIPDAYLPTHEKKVLYDQVNIEVAKALNHKKMGTNDERVTKIEQKIAELETKLAQAKTDKQKAAVNKSIKLAQMRLTEARENISTATSKQNYLDPRVTVAWCKKGQVPIEKIYNKVLLKKFLWAMETPNDWEF